MSAYMMSEAPERSTTTTSRGSVDELALLFEVSQRLDASLDMRDVVRPVLQAIVERTDLSRCTLTLLNRGTRQISIEAAYGLSSAEETRGIYAMGEGVTGRVVQTGEAVVIASVNHAEEFLNRTRALRATDDVAAREDRAFVCVPIRLESSVIGALSADRSPADAHVLENDRRLLSIVASMIAQAVRLRQLAQEAREQLESENSRLQRELRGRFRPAAMVGSAKPMTEVFDLVAQVAPHTTTVLLLGESGTGKELVAQAIHGASPRSDGPFVKVNCGALPETLLESELFGHERGAFTGAVARRLGRFEQATGGTIFLDEVGELAPASQTRLLRVLQEREFERVGGNTTLKVDVRVIAATSRDLEAMVRAGHFRNDLYYRLAIFPVSLPPLRDRGADVISLADHFIAIFNKMHLKQVRRISTTAIDLMMAYHWPGNVRELENTIERAVLLSTDDVIHGHHLPPSLQTAEATGTGARGTLKQELARVERALIEDALKSTRGNMAAAARELGVTERIMGLRVDRYAIDAQRFKARD